ncbi:MAG: hypothetical protein UV82_C0016G0045 [Candidatus Magasanikbacteria bacterium GW2011_GWD2_43_18]|nr:MAG: hypothetical protein UV18_C0004G0039 [Candidatus Magasanikbacteria bacterium GW2011_GWC2_42_27]KKT03791.1 MAG: hypothetical protein UV82_C0016G0045 [Candidatus Magasanikbacteria bacterium GW2011_GWD2_43_18]HBB38438.1 hypothetical protein [Candidatus Magasanikbacteria bacterium]HCC14204.1 hypothetical protein [Candidatus Magasanikbacteria bacterium]HCM53689.1 hypothetical protein [Candidatus Magasanikbacteria bacterium]
MLRSPVRGTCQTRGASGLGCHADSKVRVVELGASDREAEFVRHLSRVLNVQIDRSVIMNYEADPDDRQVHAGLEAGEHQSR